MWQFFAGLLAGILGSLLAAELFGWSGEYATRIVNRAVRRLQPMERRRWREDWLGELDRMRDRRLTALVYALGVNWRSRRVARAYTASPPVLKRPFDIVFAAVVLLLILPVFLMCAVALRLSVGTPIMYRQSRVGRDGSAIRVYKLRTRLFDPPVDQQQPIRSPKRYRAKGADGVTRAGRFLQKWGLDELPQLWSVLRGDMSVVGPPPLLAIQVDELGVAAAGILRVRPGLLGPSQLLGRDVTTEDFLRVNRYYVANMSMRRDLAIMGAVVRALLEPPNTSNAGR